jgi:hypothetical protein
MAWSNLGTKTDAVDTFAAADINQLMENIRVISGNGTSAPSSTIEDLTSLSSTPTRIIPGQLTLSYSNTTTFGIAAGSVSDTTGGYTLELSTAWTKTTAAWAAATGNGSLDTGSVGASKTYHVFLIRKDSDGSTDILISLSATAPTMPAGYTYKRRIGCFRTDGSNNILKFYQNGNIFHFDAPIEDRSESTLANTDRIAVTVSAPEGTFGIFNVGIRCNTSGANHYIIAQATRETDSAVSASNCTHRVYNDMSIVHIEMAIYVDTSRQIAIRGDSTTISCRIATFGWIDTGI